MNSMTGYGKAVVTREGKELTVEVKSVNHRFLDISVKMPRVFCSQEDAVRKTVQSCVQRGHVDVYVNYTNNDSGGKQAVIDIPLAKSIYEQSERLALALCITNDVKVSTLTRSSEVLSYTTAEEDNGLLEQMLFDALNTALSELSDTRELEGQNLQRVLSDRLAEIARYATKIREYAPCVAKEYAQKLTERITEALKGVDIDQSRLLNEVAFFTDKSNIDEELDRLDAHISHLYALLDESVNIGRKLDFLIQEMNREANTICSKSNNLHITSQGVLLKNEIEKLREQCQNVE